MPGESITQRDIAGVVAGLQNDISLGCRNKPPEDCKVARKPLKEFKVSSVFSEMVNPL